MKYILISKSDLSEKEITKKEALKLLKGNYRNPEYTLEHAERLFGNYINLPFHQLEIEEEYKWCKFHEVPMSRCDKTSSGNCRLITLSKEESDKLKEKRNKEGYNISDKEL